MGSSTHIVRLVMLTASSAGSVDAAEALAVAEALRHPRLVGVQDPAGIGRAVRARLAEAGLEDALREVAEPIEDRSDRELAFQLCAKVVRADGDIAGEEAGVLGDLQILFGFTNEEVKRLLATEPPAR
jgi:hypothetical protein